MSAVVSENYRDRFRRVIAHIDANLDQKLTLSQLCDVAAFSKYHFQRQFTALFGISPHHYIQLCRLKRATYMLAFRAETPVTEIALTCGYEGPESFARAFRKCSGQSPSEFRKAPHWDSWKPQHQLLSDLRGKQLKSEKEQKQVEIVDFEAKKVAVLEHRGNPNSIGNSVREFIEWRRQQKLSPSTSVTFNIVYDDPQQIAAEDYRLDICAATDREVGENSFGVISKTIPAGRCAVLQHTGSDDGLGESVKYLYSEWLPRSGEELRDFPIYFQRVKFFPDVPEAEAITDIFLPLK